MKRLEYTPEKFSKYLSGLKKGDFVIVKRRGHEFVKVAVSSSNRVKEVVRADKDAFDIRTGISEKTTFRIMCPSETVIHQWKNCIERSSLAQRANDKFSHKKLMSLGIDDLKELARIVGVHETWIEKTDRELRGNGNIHKAIADVVKTMWRYDLVVKMEFDDLEYITDMLEGRLQ